MSSSGFVVLSFACFMCWAIHHANACEYNFENESRLDTPNNYIFLFRLHSLVQLVPGAEDVRQGMQKRILPRRNIFFVKLIDRIPKNKWKKYTYIFAVQDAKPLQPVHLQLLVLRIPILVVWENNCLENEICWKNSVERWRNKFSW